MNVSIQALATKSKGNKGNYSKDSLGNIFYNGYLIKGKNINSSNINEMITYKGLLQNF